MNSMQKMAAVLAAFSMLFAGVSCGDQRELVPETPQTHADETLETLAVITDAPTTEKPQLETLDGLVALGSYSFETTTTTTTKSTTRATTMATTEPTEATTTSAESTEPFELSDEEVANKMFEYFSEKGYNVAQIAGIIGNAETESGLEPSRGVPGGGFGLFQLMDCPQRREMMAEFDAQGVGKYATSEYWSLGASNFDTEEDFDVFMTIMLDYTMNEDDPIWMSELKTVYSPELAAEVFLVHYERATDGDSPIEYYEPYAGLYYQATESRREAARRWYQYLTA